MATYYFARQFKTLDGLTLYEYVCKICTSESDRLIVGPIRKMRGLTTWV